MLEQNGDIEDKQSHVRGVSGHSQWDSVQAGTDNPMFHTVLPVPDLYFPHSPSKAFTAGHMFL